jgi:PEP-CTERM motif
MSQTDGLLLSSAEDPATGNRPLLTVNFTPAAVPEPGVLLLTGLGLATFGAGWYRRRRA